jgi:hypothetical protein
VLGTDIAKHPLRLGVLDVLDVTFQMVQIAIARQPLAEILRLLDGLWPGTSPGLKAEIWQ